MAMFRALISNQFENASGLANQNGIIVANYFGQQLSGNAQYSNYRYVPNKALVNLRGAIGSAIKIGSPTVIDASHITEKTNLTTLLNAFHHATNFSAQVGFVHQNKSAEYIKSSFAPSKFGISEVLKLVQFIIHQNNECLDKPTDLAAQYGKPIYAGISYRDIDVEVFNETIFKVHNAKYDGVFIYDKMGGTTLPRRLYDVIINSINNIND